MNKKELRILQEKYQNHMLYYKLVGYDTSNSEHTAVHTIEVIFKALGINFVDIKNEVILEKDSLLSTWNDLNDYIHINKRLEFNQENLEYITDEIKYFSEDEKQYNARIEVINSFINRLSKFDVKIPL